MDTKLDRFLAEDEQVQSLRCNNNKTLKIRIFGLSTKKIHVFKPSMEKICLVKIPRPNSCLLGIIPFQKYQNLLTFKKKSIKICIPEHETPQPILLSISGAINVHNFGVALPPLCPPFLDTTSFMDEP